MQTERDIIIKCKDGNKEAFRWVVQQYQRLVFSLALKMLVDEEEAKDVVQETFIRVWQRISDYDPQKSFTTLLYTFASRLCLDRLTQKRRILPLPDDERVSQRFANTDSQQTLENNEWVSIVRMLAEGLSPKQKLVFTLCQLEGLPSTEVEQITGLDAKQVKSNLYVARQTIRTRLKHLGYE